MKYTCAFALFATATQAVKIVPGIPEEVLAQTETQAQTQAQGYKPPYGKGDGYGDYDGRATEVKAMARDAAGVRTTNHASMTVLVSHRSQECATA